MAKNIKKTKEQAKYYEDFQSRTRGTMDKAAVQGQLFTGDRKQLRRVRYRGNENAPVIPAGAHIYFRSIDSDSIRVGLFVYVRHNQDLVVRRVIEKEVRRDAVYVTLKAESASTAEPPLKAVNVVGVIKEVDIDGRKFDPANESVAKRLSNHFTHYGTMSVGMKLLRSLLFFVPASMRPGKTVTVDPKQPSP